MPMQKVNISISPALKAIAQQAAKDAGLSLSAWFRLQVNEKIKSQANHDNKLSNTKS